MFRLVVLPGFDLCRSNSFHVYVSTYTVDCLCMTPAYYIHSGLFVYDTCILHTQWTVCV